MDKKLKSLGIGFVKDPGKGIASFNAMMESDEEDTHTCEICGRPLNDAGECIVCDLGENPEEYPLKDSDPETLCEGDGYKTLCERDGYKLVSTKDDGLVIRKGNNEWIVTESIDSLGNHLDVTVIFKDNYDDYAFDCWFFGTDWEDDCEELLDNFIQYHTLEEEVEDVEEDDTFDESDFDKYLTKRR